MSHLLAEMIVAVTAHCPTRAHGRSRKPITEDCSAVLLVDSRASFVYMERIIGP